MLTGKNLTIKYDHFTAVKDVSFEVKPGEFFGIVGPNGSGKSTLLKAVSGLLSYEGTIMVRDENIKTYSSKKRAQSIAVLPQRIELSFSYRVIEIVKMGRYAYQKGLLKTWLPKDEEKVREAMDQTGIAHFAERDIQTLSGGELQRVFLARALVQDPLLLLLDEPTNHLDISNQIKLLELINQLSRDKGLTIVAIFHDLNIAGLFCDRVMMLKKGQVQTIDTPQQALQEERLKDIYNHDLLRGDHPTLPVPTINIQREMTNRAQLNWEPGEDNQGRFTIDFNTPLKVMGNQGMRSAFEWKDHICIGQLPDLRLVKKRHKECSMLVGKTNGRSNCIVLLLDGKITEPEYLTYFQTVLLELARKTPDQAPMPIYIAATQKGHPIDPQETICWMKTCL
ncbi:ABC-type cobalamin/Fe3+-siderophores transport system ATPase subunit [Scopulibacillus darangshiensis]|uniref:ABC-type cobalamin/Fe3+-siderophores transport system ATPase subunit n=1 Tax=Scopulibacillus darangshiensis TaxID=442528 RepID=A0A4R2P9I1_9BACL|nr:ABC transporter ATP-binding protein [Scopulibacillus darangshiensis]TCP31683.1 ABC-type cobalamin/Fe3+-siderophores transport system ATPase subunit [Scopulibacillus darangshiensis]